MKQQVGAQNEEVPVDGDAGVDHFLSILREVAPRVVSANAQLEWRFTFSLRWGHPAGPQREDDDRATFAAKCARWSLRVRVPALNMTRPERRQACSPAYPTVLFRVVDCTGRAVRKLSCPRDCETLQNVTP